MEIVSARFGSLAMVSSHLEGFIKLFKFEKYFFHDLAISIYPVAVQLKFLLSLCFSTFFQGTFGRAIANWINRQKEDKSRAHEICLSSRGVFEGSCVTVTKFLIWSYPCLFWKEDTPGKIV